MIVYAACVCVWVLWKCCAFNSFSTWYAFLLITLYRSLGDSDVGRTRPRGVMVPKTHTQFDKSNTNTKSICMAAKQQSRFIFTIQAQHILFHWENHRTIFVRFGTIHLWWRWWWCWCTLPIRSYITILLQTLLSLRERERKGDKHTMKEKPFLVLLHMVTSLEASLFIAISDTIHGIFLFVSHSSEKTQYHSYSF